VKQKTYGTNYQGWVHPLSPYYFTKTEKLPKHPKPGTFGYRNWRGIVLQGKEADRAACLTRFLKHRGQEICRLLVGGLGHVQRDAAGFPVVRGSGLCAG
jgi:CRISPR system Cascade subunit CasA